MRITSTYFKGSSSKPNTPTDSSTQTRLKKHGKHVQDGPLLQYYSNIEGYSNLCVY